MIAAESRTVRDAAAVAAAARHLADRLDDLPYPDGLDPAAAAAWPVVVAATRRFLTTLHTPTRKEARDG